MTLSKMQYKLRFVDFHIRVISTGNMSFVSCSSLNSALFIHFKLSASCCSGGLVKQIILETVFFSHDETVQSGLWV